MTVHAALRRHRRLRRLIAELRAAPTTRDVDDALARLRVRFEGESLATIEAGDAAPGGGAARGGDGEPIEALGRSSAAIVRIARGVYERVPTAAGRERLLELAARAARDGVEVHVVVGDENSHLGRLAIDVPRRLLRAAGVRAAEPGDRFGPERYAHCFFDEERLRSEIRRAGLVVAARRGFTFTLRRAERDEDAAPAERPGPFAAEVPRVLRRVREVDARRERESPERVLAAMRASGARAAERGPIGRARLRRAIGWVDALVPGGANCYRRILLEVALDAGAARETVVFGLDVGRTGHVAFEGREERHFDVAFAIPAASPRS